MQNRKRKNKNTSIYCLSGGGGGKRRLKFVLKIKLTLKRIVYFTTWKNISTSQCTLLLCAFFKIKCNKQTVTLKSKWHVAIIKRIVASSKMQLVNFMSRSNYQIAIGNYRQLV